MKTWKPALILLSILTPAFAQDMAGLAEQHRYRLHVEGMSLSGEAADRLLPEWRAADIVMFGENHGVGDIANLAQALYLESIRDSSRILVTEVGPATAVELEGMVRDGSFRDFLAEGINLQSVPFFSIEEEMPLLEMAVANNPDRRAIWGLDQEFMAAAPLLLKVLESAAQNDMQRDAVADAKSAAMFNPFLFGMGDGDAVRQLRAAFADASDSRARRLTEQLELTHRIYSEQMGGDSAWSNERRETLMFENFRDYVAQTAESLPKMFFKFGGFHLYEYRSPTVREAALGLRVARWADERGLQTLNLYADCVGGEMLNALLGTAEECESLLKDQGGVFESLLFDEGMTLFDLRPLRQADGLEGMHWRVKFLVMGYDYLVLAPRTRASGYADGTLVVHRYGLIAGVLLLAVLGLLTWGAGFAWRRYRRRAGRKAAS